MKRISAIIPTVAVAALFAASCARHGTIEGQVFVVTRGGQSVKLGLVEVRAFDATVAVPALVHAADVASGELPGIQSSVQAARDADRVDDATRDSTKRYFELTSPEFYFKHLAGVPALTSAKTDADGHFTMLVTRRHSVLLAAHARRDVGLVPEEDYWLVNVSLDGQPTKQVMLSNDNMLPEVGDIAAAVRDAVK